jgi:HNH endonuclease
VRNEEWRGYIHMATTCQRCRKDIGFLEGLTLQGPKDLCNGCYQAVQEETQRRQFQARQQQLYAIRQGNLLPISFYSHLLYLDSDEICHMNVQAIYHKQTKQQVVQLPGSLIATSKKLYFLGGNKSTTIQWSNLMNISIRQGYVPQGGIFLTLSKGAGAGFYAVQDWELVAAILDAEVKIAKRQLLPQGNMFHQQANRAIPQHIINQVFQMYNGRCAECGAYGKGVELQVDHRIPFSRGGSSDINNLQLLCSVCNKKKGSRI